MKLNKLANKGRAFLLALSIPFLIYSNSRGMTDRLYYPDKPNTEIKTEVKTEPKQEKSNDLSIPFPIDMVGLETNLSESFDLGGYKEELSGDYAAVSGIRTGFSAKLRVHPSGKPDNHIYVKLGAPIFFNPPIYQETLNDTTVRREETFETSYPFSLGLEFKVASFKDAEIILGGEGTFTEMDYRYDYEKTIRSQPFGAKATEYFRCKQDFCDFVFHASLEAKLSDKIGFAMSVASTFSKKDYSLNDIKETEENILDKNGSVVASNTDSVKYSKKITFNPSFVRAGLYYKF